MSKNKIIEFTQDTKERKRWFKAASFAHPAKMHLSLQMYLIEHYTKPGDTILDPMSGSGTILVACALGRHVILVELEDKFVKMQQDNWQKIQSLGPMMFCKMGQATILKGDARNLDVVADNILFSPPYAESEFAQRLPNTKNSQGGQTKYIAQKNSIGNLPYGEISAVISSPPYNEEPTCSESYKRIRSAIGRDTTKPSQKYKKYGKADAVITSPPFEKTISGKELKQSEKLIGRKSGRDKWGNCLRLGDSQLHTYSDSQENIGNLKSENYLQAMLQVYRQCHKVLRKKGIMVLVTKNFIRDKNVVRLDLDTIKLCEQAGFTQTDRLARKLTQQSFWRTIYHKKYPNVPKLEYEDILIFQRNEQKGL